MSSQNPAEAGKPEEGLLVPENCTDKELGNIYWEFVWNFLAIPTCRMRLAVLRHASSCPACFARVLEVYQTLPEESLGQSAGTGQEEEPMQT